MKTAGVPGALARFETRRLLRHPLVLLGVAGAVGMLWWDFRSTAPVLERDSVALAGRLLPIAAVLLIATHGMATRARREQTTELLDSLPTPAGSRVRGEALASLGPVLVTLAILAVAMVFLWLGDPIGSWVWTELAVAPAVVLLACAAGLALGQWIPARVTAFVVVIAALYLHVWVDPHVGDGEKPVLASFAPFHPLDDWQPYAWSVRAPGGKLLWLVTLSAVLVVVALLRWDRRRSVVVAGIVAPQAAPGAALGGVQYVEAHEKPSAEARGAFYDRLNTGSGDVCARAGDLQLCALPGHGDWIPRWGETVRRVTDVVPAPVERVMQEAGSQVYGSDPQVVLTSMWWDRPGARARYRFDLATQVAMRAVVPAGAIEDSSCWVAGEARAAVGLWLAAQGDDGLVDELQRRVHAGRRPLTDWDAIGREYTLDATSVWLGPDATWLGLGAPDGELALDMLALPDAQVRGTVLADLDRWRDPATSNIELAQAFGLPAPVQERDMPWGIRCP
jgi:hypothetical protein